MNLSRDIERFSRRDDGITANIVHPDVEKEQPYYAKSTMYHRGDGDD